MSSRATAVLGPCDATPRWWGAARHRVVLSTMAAVLGADALLRPRARWWEWLAAALATFLALPGPASRSWGEDLVLEGRYWSRRRLSRVSVSVEADALWVHTRGARRVWCYEFIHRGRLDLEGRDVALAHRLARMSESLATAGVGVHVALRVESTSAGATRTALCLSVSAPPPGEWRLLAGAGLSRVCGPGVTPLVERRHYVRTPSGVVRTLRAYGYAEGSESHALEVLGECSRWLTLSVHAMVMPGAKGRRLTSRAVHRLGTDAQFARGAGFRWSARHQHELEILAEREEQVAAGAALCRWALYAVVHAATLAELRLRVDETLTRARGAGLRLESGTALQRDWLMFQTPGGAGW